MEIIKNIAKEILYRSLWGVAKRVFLFLLPYVFIFSLTFIVVISIFGAITAEDIPGAEDVMRYVEENRAPVVSKYGLEENHFLKWGIPLAIDLYVRNFDGDIDMRRIERVTEDLKPLFEYENYTEKEWHKETINDENGMDIEWVLYETDVKLLVRAEDVNGITEYKYREVYEESENVRKRYMVLDGKTFSRVMPSRLCRVLAREAGKDVGDITPRDEEMVLNTAENLMSGEGGEENLKFLLEGK